MIGIWLGCLLSLVSSALLGQDEIATPPQEELLIDWKYFFKKALRARGEAKWDSSTYYFRQSKEIATTAKDAFGEKLFYLEMIEIFMDYRYQPDSVFRFQQLLRDHCTLEEDTICYAQLHESYASFYLRQERYAKAIQSLRRAEEYAGLTDDIYLQLQITHLAGWVYSILGEQELNHIYSRKAKNLLREDIRTSVKLRTYANFAASFSAEQPDSVIYYAQQTLAHCEDTIGQSACIGTLNNLVATYVLQGEIEKAYQLFRIFMNGDTANFAKIPPSYLPFFTQTIAAIYEGFGKKDSALMFYEWSAGEGRLYNQTQALWETCAALSRLYENQKDYEMSICYLREKEAHARKLDREKRQMKVARYEAEKALKEQNLAIETLKEEQGEIKSQEQFSSRSLITLLAVLGGLFIFGFILFQRNRLRLTQLNEEIGLSRLNSLQASMNPRFLMNAFDTLRGLIQQKDRKKANEYLTQLSLLIRQFLENTEEAKVAFNEELTLLKSFFELEEKRLGKPISIFWEIDAALKQRNPFIPTLVIQPIMESLFSGGGNQDDPLPELRLSFYGKEQYVWCELHESRKGGESQEENKPGAAFIPHTKERIDLLQKMGYDLADFRTERIVGTEPERVFQKTILVLPILNENSQE